MITKVKNEDSNTCLAITMDGCDDLEQLHDLQNAVIWAIKSIAESKCLCGPSPEIVDLANLLECMQFTKQQLQKIDRAIFTEPN